MHPVGPLSPRVYWLRRILAIGAAVLVLVGVVWYLANRGAGPSGGASPTTAASSSSATFTGVLAGTSTAPVTSTPPPPPPSVTAASTTPPTAETPPAPAATAPIPEPTPSGTEQAPPPADPAASAVGEGSIGPAPAASPVDPVPPVEPVPAPAPEPAPVFDAEGRLMCPDSAIAVAASTEQPQLAPGQQANLSMVITNTGSQACRRDVSGTLQVFTVLGADGSRQWSTADCFPGEGTEIRTLEPGQQLRYTVKWSGTTSTPGCAGDRAALAPGSYSVVAALGGLSSVPTGFVVG